MIGGSYGIAFDLRETRSAEAVKQGLHKVLSNMFGHYYNKSWTDNRIRLEVTTRNVFLENEDLSRSLLNERIVALETNLYREFRPSVIFAFYLDDSTGGRGFSLLDTNTNAKRIWVDSEFDGIKKHGTEITEESFIQELREASETDGTHEKIYYGGQEVKIWHHDDYKHPIYGQREIIEKVMRRVLLNRFMFDYEWQDYKGDIELLDTEDFPIQDLHLLFGDV